MVKTSILIIIFQYFSMAIWLAVFYLTARHMSQVIVKFEQTRKELIITCESHEKLIKETISLQKAFNELNKKTDTKTFIH